MNRIIIFLIFVGLFSNSSKSQDSFILNFSNSNKVQQYSRWSLVSSFLLYDPAKINTYFGNYTFENKRIPSYLYGIEYEVFLEKIISFTTGLYVTKEPVFNLKYKILKSDLPAMYDEDINENYLEYAISTFSVPLIFKYNLKAKENLKLNFNLGFKLMYFPKGSAYFGVEVWDSLNNQNIEVFGLNLKSPDQKYQGSFIIGSGCTYFHKRFFIKYNITYTMNFQNTIYGEYQFANLMNSPPTKGSYKLSGNHFSFSIGIGLKNRKRV